MKQIGIKEMIKATNAFQLNPSLIKENMDITNTIIQTSPKIIGKIKFILFIKKIQKRGNSIIINTKLKIRLMIPYFCFIYLFEGFNV